MITKNGYIFFYSEHPSNWYGSDFHADMAKLVPDLLGHDKRGSVLYDTGEQWMMAGKAVFFRDTATLKLIMKANHPGKMKQLGREIKGYDDQKWVQVRYKVVLAGLVEKYRQNRDILNELLATGNETFVEASPTDKIWGIGMSEDMKGVENPKNWKGDNLLGKGITEVRTILRKEGYVVEP